MKGCRLCLSLPVLPLLSPSSLSFFQYMFRLQQICVMSALFRFINILSSVFLTRQSGVCRHQSETFKLYCPVWDFSHGKFGLFLRESQLRQNRAAQPTVDAGCFSVSIIHPTAPVSPRKGLEPEARRRALRQKAYSFVVATAVLAR